ncbi:MAG: hypothetical protein IK064_02095 [Clostridia bacterium]|nr:hypothetical protein [Clostridia bacterium]
MKTKLVKLSALIMAVLMIAAVCASCATNNNPGIGRVGKVSFKLSDYLQYYSQYSMYKSYIEDYPAFVRDQLVTYGTELNQCYERGLKLDEAEEAELAKEVEEQIESSINSLTLEDQTITGDQAIHDAKLKQFTQQLKDAGYSNLNAYKKYVTEKMREEKLIAKLTDLIKAEVSCGADEVQKYFDENAPKHKENYENDASAFATAYNNYITGTGIVPLFTPEDMFTVKHCLVQFTNASSVSDTVAGEFSEADQQKIDAIRAALEEGISFDEFYEKFVASADYNSDTIFVPQENEAETIEDNPQLGYREQGYIMNEKLLDKYYDGFGAAACILHYGDDWVIPTEEPAATAEPSETGEPETTAEPDATDEPGEGGKDLPELTPIQKYKMKFYTTTDGVRIVEVQTDVQNGGVHFIWIDHELEAGAAELNVNDTESEVYKSILNTRLTEMQNTHFSEMLTQWKQSTKVSLNDRLINSYLRNAGY